MVGLHDYITVCLQQTDLSEQGRPGSRNTALMPLVTGTSLGSSDMCVRERQRERERERERQGDRDRDRDRDRGRETERQRSHGEGLRSKALECNLTLFSPLS
jgi:hypothetical protein